MKKSLIELFVNTINMNRDCEIRKQIINDMIEFEPYAVFTRIDRGERGCIDSRDLLMFLKENGINEKSHFFKLLISYYDRDFDTVLDYQEFLSLILPNMNFLRSLSSQKVTFKIPFNEYLTKKLERQVSGLLYNQAKMFNYINIKKLDFFHNKPDLLELFRWLDLDGDGVISFSDLDVFFRNHNLVLYEEEMLALIRLYDEDLDGLWNWNEFLFMILPFRETFHYDTNKLKRLDDRYNNMYRVNNPWESNMRDCTKSPLRYNPEMSSLTTNSRSPLRNNTISPRRTQYETPKYYDLYSNSLEDQEPDRRKKSGCRRYERKDDPLRQEYMSISPKREISPEEKELIMKYSPRESYLNSSRYESPRKYNYRSDSDNIRPLSPRTFNGPYESIQLLTSHRDPYEATKTILQKSGLSYRDRGDNLITTGSISSNQDIKDTGSKKAKPQKNSPDDPEICCCCESDKIVTLPYHENSDYYICHCCEDREKIVQKYKTLKSTAYLGGDTKASEGLC
jgi:Ca2+-binding EF-hand superfamily protein